MKYYENACLKIRSGILFSFSIPADHKNFFPDFSRLENDQTFFHTFQDSVRILFTINFFHYCQQANLPPKIWFFPFLLLHQYTTFD